MSSSFPVPRYPPWAAGRGLAARRGENTPLIASVTFASHRIPSDELSFRIHMNDASHTSWQ